MTQLRPGMRLLLIVLSVAAAVRSPRFALTAEDDPRKLDKRDREVLTTALKDLTDPKSPLYVGRSAKEKPARSKIVLDRETQRFGRLQADLVLEHAEKEQAFPKELRRDWSRRKAGRPVQVSELGDEGEGILVGDIQALAKRARLSGDRDAFAREFRKAHPEAGRWVSAYLPGYSNDGRTAVVVLAGGPSPHGLTWVYRLVLVEGRWCVAWRHEHWWV